MRFAGNFSAALAARGILDREVVEEWGKGRSFVEQDKATAVRYGICGLFLNELPAFSQRNES